MSQINVEHNPDENRQDELGIAGWPVWTKEVSEFDWEYDKTETCYIVEGKAIITPDGKAPVTIERGDMVTFPKGMKCVWDIIEDIEKHYKFD